MPGARAPKPSSIAALMMPALFAAGCGGSALRPPPKWFTQPPRPDARSLYFVGDSTGAPDDGLARELAIQKALANLSQYCGAVVRSDFQSREVEKNGVLEQEVSLAVEVLGEELTLREAVVEETEVRSNPKGGFDGFARVRWPRGRHREVLEMQAARGREALQSYLEAEAAFAERMVASARGHLTKSRRVLGRRGAQVALEHERLTHSGLLWDAIELLDDRIDQFEETRRRVVAVGVDCSEQSAQVACPERVGHLRERVTAQGLKVSATSLPSSLAREIAMASSPQIETEVRDSGYLLAVTYDADLLGEEDGFTFAKCGARGAIYETGSGRIVSSTEVRARKGGHIHFRGAVDKGCSEAERALVGWIDETMRAVGSKTSASR